MSKIAFFCIPAHGHTNPTLGVVKELVSRGHEVRYYSYDNFKEKIEAAGAAFISCDAYDCEQNLSPEDGARIAKDLAFATSVLVNTTLALDEVIMEQMKQWKPDCIVADSMAVWGKAVALKLGIPFVSSTTTFAFNKYSARIMKQSFGELIRMLLSMGKVNREVKRLQDKGYPIKNILDIIQNDENTDTIVYTSKEFQPCAETFNEKYAFVGPSIRLATEEIEKSREKLIYISMGTVNNDMLPLYKRFIEAFRDSKFQVILSVGSQVDMQGFENLPEHIVVMQTVDQIAVLQKADVFITHCGMNSVSESLYYGVPLVLFPQTNEQKGVATRVTQVGAGVLLRKTDVNSIKNAVTTVLEKQDYYESAKKISKGFRDASGAKGAADKILRVAKQ